MKEFRQTFEKKVYGYYTVNARNKREAEKKFDDGDYDQFDNKEDEYSTGEWEEN